MEDKKDLGADAAAVVNDTPVEKPKRQDAITKTSLAASCLEIEALMALGRAKLLQNDYAAFLTRIVEASAKAEDLWRSVIDTTATGEYSLAVASDGNQGAEQETASPSVADTAPE